MLRLPLATACGGAANAPALAPTTEPATLEEAKAQLAEAKATLGVEREAQPRTAPVAPASGAAAPAGPTQAPQKSAASTTDAADERPADACASACNAIRSMRRAVAAICRMAGDADMQCIDARHTLITSEQRVERCSCR